MRRTVPVLRTPAALPDRLQAHIKLPRDEMKRLPMPVNGARAEFSPSISADGLSLYLARRRLEIGGRMALGALAGAIFRITIGEGPKLSLAGLVFGLVGALWLGRAGSSLPLGVWDASSKPPARIESNSSFE